MRYVLEEVWSGLLILIGTCLFLFVVWTGVTFLGEPFPDPAKPEVSAADEATYCFAFSAIQVSFRARLPVWLADRLPAGPSDARCRNPDCCRP